MKKLIAILLIVLLLGTLIITPREAKAEEPTTTTKSPYWAKTYGGRGLDWAGAVAIAPNGDIIVSGCYGANGWYNSRADVWVFRLDENGNVKWSKTYGNIIVGNVFYQTSAVAVAPNGDIIGAIGGWVFRLDEDGNVKWSKVYGGKWGGRTRAIAIAPNGDIILVGSYGKEYKCIDMRYCYINASSWILRLDENGNVKWSKTYGNFSTVDGSDDRARAVAIAPNGDIIVAGTTNSFGAGDWDAWVLRLDENGNVKWQKTYGGNRYDEAHAVAVAENGDVIVAGYTRSFGAGSRDVWVLRLDENGNVKWQKTYGGSDWDRANAVAIAENGDIIVTGSFTMRLDANGNVIWAKNVSGSAVAIAENGDIIVAGGTRSFGAGKVDVWVLRLDSNGNVKWQKAYGGWDNDYAYAVAIAPNGDIIVKGLIWGLDGIDHDMWVLRLPPDGNLPECDFCRDSNTQVSSTSAEVQTTNATVLTSNAEIHNTNAEVQDTNAEVKILCTYTPYKVPKSVSTPLPWGAFPIVIENPTDYEIETTITVKSEFFEKVKISQDLSNPFHPMPSEREDTLTIKLNPHKKKTLTIVFGWNGTTMEWKKDILKLQVGSESWSIKAEVSTATGDFFAYYQEGVTISEELYYLIKSRGFITFEGKEIKVLPIEEFDVMTNYDPRIHGWGFSNDAVADEYNILSKTGLKNLLYSITTYGLTIFDFQTRGLVPTALLTPILIVGPNLGVCAGMTYTSGLYYMGLLNISETLGNITDPSDTITVDGEQVPAKDLIILYLSAQYLQYFPELCTTFHDEESPVCQLQFFGNLIQNPPSKHMTQKEVYSEIHKYISQGRVVELEIKYPEGGHSILAYGLVKLSGGKHAVLIYDSNHPKKTRVMVIDESSPDPAVYFDPLGTAYINSVIPIDFLKPSIPQINGFAAIIDPVQNYTVKTVNGQVLDESHYFSIAREGYDVVVLPKGEYVLELQGDKYWVLTLAPKENGVVVYNLTAEGEFSIDELYLSEDGVKYKTGGKKEVMLGVAHSTLDLSVEGAVTADLSMQARQAVFVEDPEQVSEGVLKVKVDTDGDGNPDREEVFTSGGASQTSTTATMTTSTTITTTKKIITNATMTNEDQEQLTTSEGAEKGSGWKLYGLVAFLAIVLFVGAILRKKRH